MKWKTLLLGEVVEGNRMASTPYQLNFDIDRHDESICSRTLGVEELDRFRQARRGGASTLDLGDLCDLDHL